MSYNLAPGFVQGTQFVPGGNTVASGAQLFVYTAGTSTKATVYKDNAGSASWTNPIVLDSGGNLPSGGDIWIASGASLKFVLAPSNDSDPPASAYWTRDNVSGINDVAVNTNEWLTGPAPTYVSGTQFTLVGDQTATFTVNRRVKAVVSAGTIYGYVTASTYVSSTAVTVAWDSGSLDAGLSAVYYSILDGAHSSVPQLLPKLTISGALAASSTLDVTGAATLSSTLGVTGAATLSSTLDVSGASSLSSASLTGTLSSTKAAVNGYARVAPNICMQTGGSSLTSITTNTTINAPASSSAIALILYVSANANSDNAVGQRSAGLNAYSDSGHTKWCGEVVSAAYEFSALTANTNMSSASGILIVPCDSAGGSIYVIPAFSGTHSTVSAQVIGYLD